MALKTITPMLYTRQVRETVDYYINNLGFTCVGYDERWGWATVSRDDIEIMFALPNEHEPFGMPKFTGSSRGLPPQGAKNAASGTAAACSDNGNTNRPGYSTSPNGHSRGN